MTAEPTLMQVQTSAGRQITSGDRHALLGQRVPAPNPTWEATFDGTVLPCRGEHEVHGKAVFPAAGYIDVMLSAHREISEKSFARLETLEFRRMLQINGDARPRLRTEIVGMTGDLALYSRRAEDDANWTLHATARLSAAVPAAPMPTQALEEILGRCSQADPPDALYQRLAAHGLQYGPCFRVIHRIWRNAGEVLAELVMHPFMAMERERHQIHPTLLDGALQALAAIMPAAGPGGPSYVPTRIERVIFRASPPECVWSHARITKTFARMIEADIIMYDEQGRALVEISGLRCQALPRRGAGAKLRSTGSPVTMAALPIDLPLVLDASERGFLAGLTFRETERCAPRPGEVELRVTAVSLNFKDVLKLSGRLPDAVAEETFFGTDAGMEAAATVVRVGAGVTELRPGDKIIALAKGGCLRSYLTVPMEHLFWLPSLPGYDPLELVGMPIVFATALHSLRDIARLASEERVLLHSAAGGVGLAAIQVARTVGAEIYATAGSAAKRDYLQSLGIAHVMESRSLAFADEIMAATHGRGVDVVLNFLSGEALEKSMAVLAPFGRFVEIGKRDIEENSRLPLRAFNRGLGFSAVDLDRLAAAQPRLLRALLRELWDGIRAGAFRPLPVQVFPAAEIARACRIMLKGEHIGKVVIHMEDQVVPAIPRASSPSACS